MLEKCLLAVTITIALKLLLGIDFPTTDSATSNYRAAVTSHCLGTSWQHLCLREWDVLEPSAVYESINSCMLVNS